MKTQITIMMKKSVYKPGIILIIAFLLLSFGATAQNEVTKEYHEEYTAGKEITLDLDNKYGNIVVNTAETDKVVVDVQVTVRYPNKERAERYLSYIDVKFYEGPDEISVKTVFDDNFKFTGWSGESRRFTIDYNVMMPEWMDLTLANRYGNTELDDLSGHVILNIKYGNLTGAKLLRGNIQPLNLLNLAYGNGDIEEANWLDLRIRYVGRLTIENSQALLLDSKYSKLSFDKTSSIVGESKYDNLRIGSINNLVLETAYSDNKIDYLNKKLKFKASYSGLSIDRVPEGFESIEIETRYTGVNVGIDPSASYKLDGKVSYGGLKFNEDNFRYTRRIIENNRTETSGNVGPDDAPEATVWVDSSYGTIKLD